MQTVAVAIVVLFIGKLLRSKVAFFERFCVPAPVIGGFLFAIIHLILKASNIATFDFDGTLKDPFMMVFFTSIGLGASLETLKKGGKGFLIFTLISLVLVTCQNFLGMMLSKVLGENSLLGVICGSLTMVGGHGTAGAWGPTIEKLGLTGATTIGLASATFGVIMGSLIGGPIGSGLIKKYKLTPDRKDEPSFDVEDEDGNRVITLDEVNRQVDAEDFLKALAVIFVCVAFGAILKPFIFNHVKIGGQGLILPEYVAAMIFAGIFINTLGKDKRYSVDLKVNEILGDVSLNVFLVMALISLDLMELKSVAGPMLIVLMAQTTFIALFASLVVFHFMGRNYDAAVLAAGTCGFGMGATYNALANMDSVTEKYGPAPTAYFILPMVGAFAIDLINVLISTAFIQFRF